MKENNFFIEDISKIPNLIHVEGGGAKIERVQINIYVLNKEDLEKLHLKGLEALK